MTWDEIEQNLKAGETVLLDGALGTELQRHSVNTDRPSWTAKALLTHPELIEQIHRDYVNAGAEIVTANTFRTHRRSLVAEGLDHRAKELTARAVELAVNAADGSAIVAGSLAPLEDCYRPDLTPIRDELKTEHRLQAETLADAGVDLILIETQNSLEEAAIALEATTRTKLPVFISFVVNEHANLLSGESISQAVESVTDFNPAAILTNCCPITSTENSLRKLNDLAMGIPFGLYPNTGIMNSAGQWEESEIRDPKTFGKYVGTWKNMGAQLIGGCCGTTPAHINEAKKAITP